MMADRTIYHRLELYIRLVNRNTLQPVAKAVVSVEGVKGKAVQKDGGYYIFTGNIPKKGRILIKHPDYAELSAEYSSERMTVYLEGKVAVNNENPVFICRQNASKGEQKLIVNCVNYPKSIIIDGCIMRLGDNEYKIESYSQLTGECVLESRLHEDIKTGDKICILVNTGCIEKSNE